MRFFPKTSSNTYIKYNPHTLNPLIHSSNADPNSNYVIGVFIDPGLINCAIRVCKNDLTTGKIETLLQVKLDFKKNTSNKDNEIDIYNNSIGILDYYLDFFKWSHYIIIEKQLPINYSLVRMSQHIISYFMINLRNKGFRPLIYEIDPKQKSHLLGGKFKMSKPQLKVWCKNKALEILTTRGDESTKKLIISSKKQDDHGDTVCYDECWWILMKNDKIPFPINNKIKIIIF